MIMSERTVIGRRESRQDLDLLYNCGEIKRGGCDSVDVWWNVWGRLDNAGLQTSFDLGVLIEFAKTGTRFAFVTKELEECQPRAQSSQPTVRGRRE